jgi:hypothetical protein
VVTSSGNQDGGLFEVSPRDERYLAFEGAGAGAVSRWRLARSSGWPVRC